MRIFIILVLAAILSSCKKKTAEPDCYKCVFGSILIGGVLYQPEPEVHCEQGAANFKKYITIPGTQVNNWQLPTNCKAVK